MVFWGFDVVDGFTMYRKHRVLLCFMTVLDTTWKPLRETFGYLFSLHFGRTLLLAARAGSRPHDFKSGCFAWEGLSRFAKVVVSRRRNERWRFQASAQIRRPKKKRRFAQTRRNIFRARQFDPASQGLVERPATSPCGDFPWFFGGLMSWSDSECTKNIVFYCIL